MLRNLLTDGIPFSLYGTMHLTSRKVAAWGTACTVFFLPEIWNRRFESSTYKEEQSNANIKNGWTTRYEYKMGRGKTGTISQNGIIWNCN